MAYKKARGKKAQQRQLMAIRGNYSKKPKKQYKYIKNANGTSYRVLASKNNLYGRKDYLLKSTNKNSIQPYIVADSYSPKHKSWDRGHYYSSSKNAYKKFSGLSRVNNKKHTSIPTKHFIRI